MPWMSNTAAVYSAPLSLTSQLSPVKQPCHCAWGHFSAAVSSHPSPAQPAESWPIFNSLDAEAIGISSTCSPSWLASSVLTWPPEDCNSQNICAYCTAQAMREHCLKTTHLPHGAGYSPNNRCSTDAEGCREPSCSLLHSDELQDTMTQPQTATKSSQITALGRVRDMKGMT